MADIAAGNVSYSISKRSKMEDSRMMVNATITFGNGALTYPSGGIPLTKASLGCPVTIDSLFIEDAGAGGYVYQYDKANEKLRIFRSGAISAHVHDLKVIGGAAGGIDEPIGVEGTDTLAKDAATDRTIAGANSATKGGVISGGAVSAAVLSEVTGLAIAAQTVKVTLIGY